MSQWTPRIPPGRLRVLAGPPHPYRHFILTAYREARAALRDLIADMNRWLW